MHFLSEKMTLTLKISVLHHRNHGLSFLGFRVFPTTTRLNKRSKKRFVQKAKEYEQLLNTNQWTEAEYVAHITPLIANVSYADTLELRRKVFCG